MLSSCRCLTSTSLWSTLPQYSLWLNAALDPAVLAMLPSLPSPSPSPSSAAYYSAAAGSQLKFYNVPAGHIHSDLSSSACHIGLGRRRDLTLRQDLRLHSHLTQSSLAEVFKGKKVIIVGFPGGKVCTEKHLPGFVSASASLRQKGVNRIICVSVGDPGELETSLKAAGLDLGSIFEVYQDKNGAFVRLLGLDLGDPDCGQGPKCQRFAAVVDDGILLKLCVEKSARDLQITDASSISQLWDKIYR